MKGKSIVIIGGGITGLTAAYYMQKKIVQMQLPYKVSLLESSNRLGGKIQTTKKDGFLIERGPDSFLGRKHAASRLVESLQLSETLVKNKTGQAYILSKEQLHKIPAGSFMGIPTKLQPLLHTTLLSNKGKARLALDFVLARSMHAGDQSLGCFLRRRFGDEVVDHMIEPLLSGIYAGDIDEMSLLATFPQFFELEQSYKSVIKGIRQTMETPSTSTGKKPGQFLTSRTGLETIVQALEKALPPSMIQKGWKVKQLEKKNHSYLLYGEGGERIEADAVIATTPHDVLKNLVKDASLVHAWSDMTSHSVANVTFAYDTDQLGAPLDGTGFVVSRHSDYRITACTWTHKKWPHTTPAGKALLRAYVGKPTDQSIVNLPDQAIIDIALQDIKRSMGIKKDPLFSVVTRWEKAMPQYTVGHKARLLQLKRNLHTSMPGLFVGGSSFEGVGIPDCIAQAEKMVEEVLSFLNK